MTERFKKYITKTIWVALVAFCIRCLFEGVEIIGKSSLYDMYGYAGEAIAFTLLIMCLYEKWLWRYNPLEETPVLKEKYRGIFVSTYDGIERNAVLEIRQTLLSVHIIFTSEESRSTTIAATIDKVFDEWQLMYLYINKTQANVREKSAVHYGTAMLNIDNPQKLTGQYFADRKTTGDMHFIAEEKNKAKKSV